MTTKTKWQRYREICDGATEGPWTADMTCVYQGDALSELTNDKRIARCNLTPTPGWNSSAEFIAAARTGWPETLDEVERLGRLVPRCSHCDEPATCIGAYEDPRNLGFGCDDCCGHGNEDGWCEQLTAGTLSRVLFNVARAEHEAEQERDQLRAENERLAARVAELTSAKTGGTRDEFVDRFTRWLMPNNEVLRGRVLERTTLDGLYNGSSTRIYELIHIAYARGVRRGAGCVWEAGQKVTTREGDE